MRAITTQLISRCTAILACAAALAACQHAPVKQTADVCSRSNRSVTVQAPTSTQGTSSGASGAPAAQPNAAPAITLHLARLQPEVGLTQVQVNPQVILYAAPRPVLTQADLKQIVPMQDAQGKVFLSLEFNPRGAAKLAHVTREAVGHYLLFSVRGKLFAIPRINAPQENGKFAVPLGSVEEAQAVVQRLKQTAG